MKWLNSLDELLFEVMSWLIFYPVTLWRTLAKPLETMRYADEDSQDATAAQFTDTLSPPLFQATVAALALALLFVTR